MNEHSSEFNVGYVYGIRRVDSDEYRYVGQTSKSIEGRAKRHWRVALSGRRFPVYDWMRKHYPEELEFDELEVVASRESLGLRERWWIEHLRNAGHRLLNISDGGLGPTGVEWTTEQREAARVRSTGRKGLSRPGAANPFYGKKHSEEQRAKWSLERQGSITGTKNPNFGKFGSAHPSFGHRLSEETRRRLSEQKRGKLNPMYGKKASPESLAKRSEAQKGIPKPGCKRSAHTRHHTNKNVHKAECQYCVDDANSKTKQKESEGKNVSRSG